MRKRFIFGALACVALCGCGGDNSLGAPGAGAALATVPDLTIATGNVAAVAPDPSGQGDQLATLTDGTVVNVPAGTAVAVGDTIQYVDQFPIAVSTQGATVSAVPTRAPGNGNSEVLVEGQHTGVFVNRNGQFVASGRLSGVKLNLGRTPGVHTAQVSNVTIGPDAKGHHLEIATMKITYTVTQDGTPVVPTRVQGQVPFDGGYEAGLQVTAVFPNNRPQPTAGNLHIEWGGGNIVKGENATLQGEKMTFVGRDATNPIPMNGVDLVSFDDTISG